VTLDDPGSTTPTFTAPELTGDADITFELQVSDGENTTTETVSIHVAADNDGPEVRVEGPDFVMEGDEVRTMMGISPEVAAEFLVEHGADVAAFNCGTGIDMAKGADIARRYRATCDLPILGQPNAGQPELDGLEVVYRETPEQMAAGVAALIEAGARMVGGCCGSTPAHIRAFRQVIDGLS